MLKALHIVEGLRSGREIILADGFGCPGSEQRATECHEVHRLSESIVICMGTCMDWGIDMRMDMHMDMCMGMCMACVWACVWAMCMEMCMGMCMDMCMGSRDIILTDSFGHLGSVL